METSKTIAFYIGSLSRGGAERVIVNLAEHFYEKGYTTYVVTKFIANEEYSLSQGIIRIVADLTDEELSISRVKNFFGRIRKLRKIWKTYKPNAIVSFIGKNNFMTIASTRGLKIPVVVSVRSAPHREYAGKLCWNLAKFLFPMANGIVLQTAQAKSEFSKRIQRKAAIMDNPLHEQFIIENLPQVRNKQVVTVGRLDENKNQGMLIEVFAKLAQEYPDWTCHIYGDGPNRSILEKQIEAHSLNGQIILEGKQSKVVEAIRDASVFVLPSRIEGMPNALIEAMSLGLCPISTDCPCGGPGELIEHEKNGLLIPVDDRSALENALRTVMNDNKICSQLGAEAHKIGDCYRPDVVLQKWQTYIESLM